MIAMAAAVALKLGLSSVVPTATLHQEVHAVAAYLAVVGALYGIVVAFLMFVVWEQFKDMDNQFTGVWNVSYAVMTEVASRIG
jgi:hypothetical protein